MNAPAVDYDRGWTEWGDMIRHSPAPFHRRRLILELASQLKFSSVLDVGCGNGEVLSAFAQRFPGVRLVGADLSGQVIAENRGRWPSAQFHQLDLGAAALDERCDLVVCTEVVEHVPDWQRALRHLRQMCGGHLIVTVPCGKLFPIDRMMGHVRHFRPEEFAAGLQEAGFAVERSWQWGFPFHTLYKSLINLSPERSMQSFGASSYGTSQKLIASLVGAAFYLNLRSSPFGRQLVVLARAV
jgi:trans-aconitate methyltransferase